MWDRGVCPVCHMASETNVRFFFQIKLTRSPRSGCLAPTELHCFDAKCGTVVPSQVSLPLMEVLVLVLVWRHTEVGYVRNRTLEGQR